MVEDDWGPNDFDGGDYPVIGDVAATSAPGKRAKRTFNKQQYTLDAMAAGTVVLDRSKGTLQCTCTDFCAHAWQPLNLKKCTIAVHYTLIQHKYQPLRVQSYSRQVEEQPHQPSQIPRRGRQQKPVRQKQQSKEPFLASWRKLQTTPHPEKRAGSGNGRRKQR